MIHGRDKELVAGSYGSERGEDVNSISIVGVDHRRLVGKWREALTKR